MRGMLRSREARFFGLGIMAAVVGYFLAPVARRKLKPVAKQLVAGAMVAGEKIQETMARAKEGMEDVVAQARFERLQQQAQAQQQHDDFD